MEAAGRRNAYVCNECGGIVVTVNRHEGVTPMMLRCRATPSCGGMMASRMYRLPPGAPEPSFEWYSPSRSERRKLSPAMRDHVDRGGLDIRPIKPAGEQCFMCDSSILGGQRCATGMPICQEHRVELGLEPRPAATAEQGGEG